MFILKSVGNLAAYDLELLREVLFDKIIIFRTKDNEVTALF